jgi:hypothetical protein
MRISNLEDNGKLFSRLKFSNSEGGGKALA